MIYSDTLVDRIWHRIDRFKAPLRCQKVLRSSIREVTLRAICAGALIGALSLALGGCIGGASSIVRVYGIAVSLKVIMALEAQGATAVSCSREERSSGDWIIKCSYKIGGVDQSVEVVIAQLGGAFSAFLDPLIVQVPAAATEFTGTFASPAASGNLTIIDAGASLPADINRQIIAEPGMKLVVLDFPAPPATNQVYDYALQFSMPPGTTSVPAKVMFAGKVVANGQTYYPPFIPCETDFARIPQLQLPVINQFTNVNLSPLAGVRGCQGTRYLYGADPGVGSEAPIPVLFAPVLALLALLVGAMGALSLRRRRSG